MSYTATRSRAADLLSRKGQTVTIAGETGGAYDIATATVSGTPYSVSAKAVILPLSPTITRATAAYRQEPNTNIRAGDEQMLLAGLDIDGAAVPAPPLNSVVTLADGTTTYTIIAIEPLHPDGTNLIFDCVVRGA